MKKPYVTYILQCQDKSLYTGWTNDIEKRIAQHNAGQGAKYTRGRLPVIVIYLEQHPTQHKAMQREAHIKKLSRHQKLLLISSGGGHTDTRTA